MTLFNLTVGDIAYISTGGRNARTSTGKVVKITPSGQIVVKRGAPWDKQWEQRFNAKGEEIGGAGYYRASLVSEEVYNRRVATLAYTVQVNAVRAALRALGDRAPADPATLEALDAVRSQVAALIEASK